MYPIKGKYLTKDQGLELVKSFEKSGLKAPIFCHQKNINLCVLQYWRTKTKKLSRKEGGNLIPVKVISSSLYTNIIKITIRGLMTIDVSSETDISTLKKVLEVCKNVANG